MNPKNEPKNELKKLIIKIKRAIEYKHENTYHFNFNFVDEMIYDRS